MEKADASCAVFVAAPHRSAEHLVAAMNQHLAAYRRSGDCGPLVWGTELDTQIRSVIVTSSVYQHDRIFRDALFGATHALVVSFSRACAGPISLAFNILAERYPLRHVCGTPGHCTLEAVGPTIRVPRCAGGAGHPAVLQLIAQAGSA